MCFVWCVLFNVDVDDDDDDEDEDEDEDDDDDDDDDAIACRESRPERMLLYSRP